MKRKIQVFTHTDLDGIISPVVLEKMMRLKFPREPWDFEVTYCETGSYGTIDAEILAFIEKHETPERIYITDISPSLDIVDKLNDYCVANNIKWRILDHHKTALSLRDKYPMNAAVLIDDKKTGTQHAGVSLAFQEFTGYMPDEFLNVIPGPRGEYRNTALLASLVRSYDTWDWAKDENDKWKEDAKRFDLLRLALGRDKLLARFKHGVAYPFITETETTILDVLDEQERQYIEEKVAQASYGSFNHEDRIYVFSFVTAEQYKSTLGNALSRLEVNGKQVDFAIVFNNGTMSLRSSAKDVDVSMIARTYFEGGGHPLTSGGHVIGFDAFELVKKQFA